MKQATVDCDIDTPEFADAVAPFVLSVHRKDRESGVDLVKGLAEAVVAQRNARKDPLRAQRAGGTPTPVSVPAVADNDAEPSPEDAEAEAAGRERARRRLAARTGIAES